LHNVIAEVEYGNGGEEMVDDVVGWQYNNVMPKFFNWELLDYVRWYSYPYGQGAFHICLRATMVWKRLHHIRAMVWKITSK